ncbi:hypothetical protein BDV24DRAFT_170545 [Aspergillus arachidicola]|uniref:Uncharacterized protein n=1 Tax=Aspergillus arachidicola TaxID=656916 RepID=A0A5N6XLH4_9EURO|nr:hypothetical protein BDV24DRAFT_170545 [Aspergillus arachidicola]
MQVCYFFAACGILGDRFTSGSFQCRPAGNYRSSPASHPAATSLIVHFCLISRPADDGEAQSEDPLFSTVHLLSANGSLWVNEGSVFLPSASVRVLTVRSGRETVMQLIPFTYYPEASYRPTTTNVLTTSTETKTADWSQTACSLDVSRDPYEIYGHYTSGTPFGLWHNRDQFYHQLRTVAPSAAFGALVGILTGLVACCVCFFLSSSLAHVKRSRQRHRYPPRQELYSLDKKPTLV